MKSLPLNALLPFAIFLLLLYQFLYHNWRGAYQNYIFCLIQFDLVNLNEIRHKKTDNTNVLSVYSLYLTHLFGQWVVTPTSIINYFQLIVYRQLAPFQALSLFFYYCSIQYSFLYYILVLLRICMYTLYHNIFLF